MISLIEVQRAHRLIKIVHKKMELSELFSMETILGEGLARHFLHQDGSNKVYTDIRSTLVGCGLQVFFFTEIQKVWENKGSLEYFLI